MTHTFYLKQPNSNQESLIYFSCYFKYETKKFVYSTGEKILPINWNKENNTPIKKGKNKSKNATSIQMQLDRYTHKFLDLQERLSIVGEEFTSSILKLEFDKEFKKEIASANHFFSSYDKFISYHKKMNLWAKATLKKYDTLRNILCEFEEKKQYKLTFSKVNNNFISEFTDFCYSERDHSTNTFRRNLGLFKTFMNWALTNKLTYNDKYTNFKKPKAIIPKMFALNLEEIKKIHNKKMEKQKLEKVKDVFVFQCLTGMRYTELYRISKTTIKDGNIILKENKDIYKNERFIPLASIAYEILEKYQYSLPLISNQKYNEYIKDVIELSEIDYEVEISRIKGKEQIFNKINMSEKISSHSARSSFITNMKNQGVPDKTIMAITGHKDLKTFLTYYRVNDMSTKDAVTKVFGEL